MSDDSHDHGHMDYRERLREAGRECRKLVGVL